MSKYDLDLRVRKRKAGNSKINRVVFILPILLIFLVIALVNFFKEEKVFEEVVEINLIGAKFDYLSLNSDYHDEGFELCVNDVVLNNKDLEYNITDNINPYVLGEYKVNYEVLYNSKSYKIERIVTVVDREEPLISVDTEQVEYFECGGKIKDNLSFTVLDNYDGVLTDKVKRVDSDSEIILSVTDSSGNEASVTIPRVEVVDPSTVIKLNGKSIIYLQKGSTYSDEGATVYDGCGKKSKLMYEVSNKVDINTIGEYFITYTVKDEDGKKITSKKRKVIVYDKVSTPTVDDSKSNKIVYLTFDDGPGRYTKELLNILDKYNAKVTFFVTNQFKNYVPLIKDIDARGHAVAVHTLTHKWSIYRSVETYMKDFNDMNDIIEKYTGKRSKIFRFPGGASNTVSKGYSKGVVSAIASRMNELGYVYFDWNVDSNDAAGASRDDIVKNVIDGMKRKNNAVVLMHDIKKNTLNAIEEILVYGVNNGYTFKALTASSPTCHHRIQN